MIVYSKAFWQLPLALHFGRGSPLTRNLLLPALSCVETVLLYLYTCKHVVEPLGSAEGEDGEDGLNVAQCAVKWVRAAPTRGAFSSRANRQLGSAIRGGTGRGGARGGAHGAGARGMGRWHQAACSSTVLTHSLA